METLRKHTLQSRVTSWENLTIGMYSYCHLTDKNLNAIARLLSNDTPGQKNQRTNSEHRLTALIGIFYMSQEIR